MVKKNKCCKNEKKIVSLQRIMSWKTLTYRVVSWLKFHLTAWNTGGEGVHSPYLFEWVRMVMMDRNSYYSWDAIEDCRRAMLADDRELEFVDYGSGKLKGENGKLKSENGKLKGENGKLKGENGRLKGENGERRRVCDIAKRSLTKRKYAEMLFRLVNWLGASHRLANGSGTANSVAFRGLTIVELGTSLGVTTAYLAMPDSRNRVLTFEGCASVAEVAEENWRKLNVKNIQCVVGAIDAAVLSRELSCVDVAFVDANHTYAGAREYFNVLASMVHEKSVIVMDDIHYSSEMERAWKEICEDERVTSTMDLYQMGLVFFDPHYWHRNYRMRL